MCWKKSGMEHRQAAETLRDLGCGCATLRRAARAVTALYDQELKPCGLRVTQFTLLEALGRAGEITQGQLGEILGIDSTTLTRSLALLRRRGWLAARPGPDRRERLWRLAAAGRRELLRARPYWERAQSRLRAALGPGEWKNLLAELNRAAGAALAA